LIEEKVQLIPEILFHPSYPLYFYLENKSGKVEIEFQVLER